MYAETNEDIHSPAYKMSLIRDVYRRYKTFGGKLFPWLYGAKELNVETLNEITQAMFECTGCRRCTAHCPFGLDPAWIMSAGRNLARLADKSPMMLGMIADVTLEKAKNISNYEELYAEQIKEIEYQLKDETNNPSFVIPLKKMNAEILYVPVAGAHSIIPAAKIFNAAEADWTLSQLDATNYNFFVGNIAHAKEASQQIIKEAENLNVKTVVMTECGHGFRIMRHIAQEWFNTEFGFEVKSISEQMAEYVNANLFTLDPSKNPGIVTYHDPCQLGRNGGVYEDPRTVIKATTKEFREMSPTKEFNWCCGGGGGLVALPEYKDLRMQTGKQKVQQIQNIEAEIVAHMCENCKSQLSDLNEHYQMNVEIVSVMELLANAIVTKEDTI
jgi:Fe-S oxidoreductase